jgi:2-dehydro-3-deoxygalactonokinase
VKLVPGLATEDTAGVPEVMRGEETQIVGCLSAIGGAGLACLPGSHSKWARIEAGRITGFTTHLTGEAFAALRGHTILARMMRDGATDLAVFDQGVTRSGDADGLLHHVFGARTLALTGRMAESATASYLSGILIGHEVRAALSAQRGTVVQLIGTPELTALYARAIAACGCYAERHDGDAAAHGLAAIGEHAAWS